MFRRTLLLPAVGVILAGAVAAGCGSSGSASTSTTTTSAAPAKPVSGPLIGVTFDGPALYPNVNLSGQVDRAVASGVESLRVAINWAEFQPYRTPSDVPAGQRSLFVTAGGVPTRFVGLDRLVALAAQRHLPLLPVLEYTPSWDATHPGNLASPPKDTAPYAAALTALIDRYGPNGTFWSAHPQIPKVPIRMWQIWNEPHFVSYWTTQPFAPSYVALLQAAHAAIKAADPGATVVLAGLADFSWRYLEQIYRVPNARGLFDIVAIHPYTATPQGVITILQRARQVMDRNGDSAKPILATEITWPSSEGKAPAQFGVSTTEPQQAQRLAQVMPLLSANASKLGLMGFYWYTWMGNETPSKHPYGFDFAGLEKYIGGAISAKPALGAFTQRALQIEHCTRKATATSCA
jgi:hypothetical protein